MPDRRGRRAETMASSDIANTPLNAINPRMISTSGQGKGFGAGIAGGETILAANLSLAQPPRHDGFTGEVGTTRIGRRLRARSVYLHRSTGDVIMRNLHRLGTASLAAALLATTACTTNPETGERRLSRAAIGALGGTVAGFFAGDLIGGKRDRTEKIVGAGIGAIAGGAVGAYMDRQQRELERQTAGTGIDVIRQGDELVLNMPSGITFASSSFAIQPQFRDTLNQVAQTLKSYEQTFIDVRGHTDSTAATRSTCRCRRTARRPWRTTSSARASSPRASKRADTRRRSRWRTTTPKPASRPIVGWRSRSYR
jgi:hypothetical protein